MFLDVVACQKEATQAALDLLQSGDKPNGNYPHSGTLQISELIFHLRKDHAHEEQPAKKFEEYFVVLLASGKTVLASQVLLADDTGLIASEKLFEFTGLHTDFEVTISIYSLQVKCGHSADGKHPKKVLYSGTMSHQVNVVHLGAQFVEPLRENPVPPEQPQILTQKSATGQRFEHQALFIHPVGLLRDLLRGHSKNAL